MPRKRKKSLFVQYRTVVSISIIVSALVGYLAGAIGHPLALARLFTATGTPAAPQTTLVAPTSADTSAALSQDRQVVNLVKRSSPAVVSIIITKDVPKYETYYVNPFGGSDSPFGNDPFFNQFFGNGAPNIQVPRQRQNGTQQEQVGAGSGFVVRKDGLIVTNRHVVEDTNASYTVILNDGGKYPANVLARDPVKDIAIIKIKAGKELPTLPLGDDSNIQIGQTVIAIGNALGQFSNTVSKGVVSGLSRSIVAGNDIGQSEQLNGVIQTDAAINPGNSGGPLIALNGNVIGMNTAVAQGAQSIGFAIPIDEVKSDLTQIENGGKIVYPYLGVRYTMITPAIKKANNLSVSDGALITRGQQVTDLAVIPGSPADKAGLVENDIILEVNGIKLTQNNPLVQVISKFKPGKTVTLTVFHRGSTEHVQVTLGQRPDNR